MRTAPFLAIATVVVAGCTDPVATGSDRQADTSCAQATTIHGIDVSYYDDVTDWSAARGAGIDFAFIRVSDGTQFQDPKFASYWAGAKAAGVIRGAYQFFRPEQDPVAQADLLLQMMGPLEPGDIPPVIDVEVADGRSPAQVAAAVRAWIAHVAAATGKTPIVYTGLYLWNDLTGGADVKPSPLWIAQYTTAPCPDIPAAWPGWEFWQYTDSGAVAGVTGSGRDLDLYDGSRDDLLASTGAPFCGDGTCDAEESSASCPADCPPTAPPDAGLPDPSGNAATHAMGGCSTGRGGGGLLVIALALVLAAGSRRSVTARAGASRVD